MVRPRKNRIVAFDPDVSYFKPRGISMIELEEVRLTVDECESIRRRPDLHGPDVPRMLGLEGMLTLNQSQKLTPMSFSENLQAVSVKSLTQNKDDAIIWRGPIKHSAKGNSSKEN